MKLSIIKSLIRSLLKGNSSSIINLIGLSFGFAVLIAITFYIREELSVNQFHDKIDNIYTVFTIDNDTDNGIGYEESVPALANALRTEFPEVEDAALYYGGTLRFLIDYEGVSYYEQVQLAEYNMFNIFSLPILKGEIPKKNHESNIVALSNKTAIKYFGNDNPIGKQLKVNNDESFTVVAVFDDIPSNSTIDFDFWFPIKLLDKTDEGDALDTWYNLSFNVYAMLNQNASLSDINIKLYGRIQQSNPGSLERAQLYPFKDLYLEAWGANEGVQMMSMIAILILVLVCLNFINLKIAESFISIKSFGLKRINGASNFAIVWQLIVESLLYCIAAVVVAFGITYSLSGYLFNLLGMPASNATFFSSTALLIVLVVAIVIATISGLIPGLVIKVVSPVNAIKNKVTEHLGVKRLRMVFTTLQFCMAIILVICLLTTNKQLNLLKNKDLGFNTDQIVYVHIEGELQDKKELLREELTKHPAILSATLASRSPVGIYWNGGGWDWEGKTAEFNPLVTYIETDEYFQNTFGIEMKEGSYVKNDVFGMVINETFANIISKNKSVLSKLLVHPEDDIQAPVVGVIKDIHFKSLRQQITPLMIIPQLGLDQTRYIFIKLSQDKMEEGLAYIKETIGQMNPDFPCEHFFLDNDFERLYNYEESLRDQMLFFSLLALIISCMGLWGILLFMMRQRIKEIGIRKVNGAKISEILQLLNSNFVKWIVAAFIIACPIAYYIMNSWLENFAYRTIISWWIFALAGLITLLIALLTVSFQTYRAARRNPVEALRYE